MKNRVFSFLPRFSILLLFLGMVIGEAYAQSQTITGVVKDQTGEPLIGVNVMEKGTTNGSITDVDGKYSLTVNGSKAIVTFSYIGYLSQDITVGNQKMIDVTMKEDTEELEEVVVIGYGTAKKKDLTGAISTVKAENMENSCIPCPPPIRATSMKMPQNTPNAVSRLRVLFLVIVTRISSHVSISTLIINLL